VIRARVPVGHRFQSRELLTGECLDLLVFVDKQVVSVARIALPSFSAVAICHQLADATREPDSFLFLTKTGRPLSVRNFERLLRTFVSENKVVLNAAGIETEEFTTHVFRRTAATLVESVAAISLAARLLGHASEQVTRASYVATAELIGQVTALILDEALDSSGG
jgi:integrase